jgi:spore coat polysaccharide biosynthesis predicted glycosyltransferase SpsG
MFSAESVANLKRMVARSHHHIVLVTAPPTLLNEMLWCDVAIGANGLTKYELAATATPALLFSIDAHHDLVNRPFAARQTSIDLGIGVSPEKIGQEVSGLLGNVALRSSMAKCGRMLVDGGGVERLFIEIKKELFC